jgi:hypothetical protein
MWGFGMSTFRIFRVALVAVPVLLIAACASDPARLPLGGTRDQVLQQLGPPTAIYPDKSGERLQYSRGPLGFEVTNVDIDSTGRVRSVTQELDEGLFDRTIQPGSWREQDILRTYGRPYEITRVLAFDGTVWTWRYRHINDRRLLYVYVDQTGVVDHFNVGDDLLDDNRHRH